MTTSGADLPVKL